MQKKKLIPLPYFCSLYEVEVSFVARLKELGLVQIKTLEEDQFITNDSIYELEKMIRMHQDLEVNPEGIDVIFNLLEKVNSMHLELTKLRNKLNLYE